MICAVLTSFALMVMIGFQALVPIIDIKLADQACKENSLKLLIGRFFAKVSYKEDRFVARLVECLLFEREREVLFFKEVLTGKEGARKRSHTYNRS